MTPTSEIRSGLAIAGVASFAGIVLIKIYQKCEELLGARYSAEEIEELDRLKHCYQSLLCRTSPSEWMLGDNNEPLYTVLPFQWRTLARQLSQQRGGLKIFHHFSTQIAEITTKYLDERADRTYFRRGRRGDIIEKFFADWMVFAVNELAYLDPEQAKTVLKQRIDYLRQVDRHLLTRGTFSRVSSNNDKKQVVKMLISTLKQCYYYAEQEAIKFHINHHLQLIKTDMGGLLSNLARYCFYVRGSDVHLDSFMLLRYVQGPKSDEAILALDRRYQELVIKTHSGSLLKEFIVKGGLLAFGTYSDQELSTSDNYFDSEGKAITIIDWSSRGFDAPPWASTMEEKKEFIVELQNLGAMGIKLAKVARIIALCYEVAGLSGDVWALGDCFGREALILVMLLLKQSIQDFKVLFMAYLEKQQVARERYNIEHSLDETMGVNHNFNEADDIAADIQSGIEALLERAHQLESKIESTPKDLGNIAERKKAELIVALHDLLSRETEHTTSVLSTRAQRLLQQFQEKKMPTSLETLRTPLIMQPLLIDLISIPPVPRKRWYHFAWTRTAAIHSLLQDEEKPWKQLQQCILFLKKIPVACVIEQCRDIEKKLFYLMEINARLQVSLEQLTPRWEWSVIPFHLRLGWPFNQVTQRTLAQLCQRANQTVMAIKTHYLRVGHIVEVTPVASDATTRDHTPIASTTTALSAAEYKSAVVSTIRSSSLGAAAVAAAPGRLAKHQQVCIKVLSRLESYLLDPQWQSNEACLTTFKILHGHLVFFDKLIKKSDVSLPEFEETLNFKSRLQAVCEACREAALPTLGDFLRFCDVTFLSETASPTRVLKAS